MTVKTTGAEFKRFYSDPSVWVDGAWHDDELVEVAGKNWDFSSDIGTIPDGAVVVIVSGIFYKDANDEEGCALAGVFRQWQKRQSTTVLIVDAPNDKLDAITSAIRAAGGSVASSKN